MEYWRNSQMYAEKKRGVTQAGTCLHNMIKSVCEKQTEAILAIKWTIPPVVLLYLRTYTRVNSTFSIPSSLQFSIPL